MALKFCDPGVLSCETVNMDMFRVGSALQLQSIMAIVREKSSSTPTGSYLVDIVKI